MNKEALVELEKKLNPNNVKKHPFTGMDYIEGWHSIAEANRIFGHDGWSRETLDNREVCRYDYAIKNKGNGFKVGYEALVRITVGNIVRYGTGHGSSSKMDLFDCIEGAAKEAETDAMKRALMTFGNQFGLALYDKTKSNVGVEAKTPPAPKKEMADAEKRDWMSKKTAVMVKNLQTMGDLNGLNAFTQSMDKTLEALKAYPDLNESWGLAYAKRLGELK